MYGVLKEAEHRSTFYIPYWNLPFAKNLVPRQRKFFADLAVINDCLDDLIAQAKNTRQTDDVEALQARDYSKVPFGLPSAVLNAFWCHLRSLCLCPLFSICLCFALPALPCHFCVITDSPPCQLCLVSFVSSITVCLVRSSQLVNIVDFCLITIVHATTSWHQREPLWQCTCVVLYGIAGLHPLQNQAPMQTYPCSLLHGLCVSPASSLPSQMRHTVFTQVKDPSLLLHAPYAPPPQPSQSSHAPPSPLE